MVRDVYNEVFENTRRFFRNVPTIPTSESVIHIYIQHLDYKHNTQK